LCPTEYVSISGYSAGAYVRVLDKEKEADERYVYVPWRGQSVERKVRGVEKGSYFVTIR